MIPGHDRVCDDCGASDRWQQLPLVLIGVE
jgi:hypothetical protein